MTIVTAAGSQPRTPKAERTRASLLDSARFVFNRDGLAEARVTDIVKKSGVSHGTFYTYFTSKQDIFEHVVLEFLAEIRTAIDALKDGKKRTPYEAIHRENFEFVRVLKENARIVGLLLVHSMTTTDNVTTTRQEDLRYFAGRAERAIEHFQEVGLAHTDIDPQYAARALTSMVEQFCVQWVTQEWDFDIETAAQQLTHLWARSLGLEVPAEAA